MSWDAYEFWLTNDIGARITDQEGVSVITRVLWLEASRVTNGYGTFRMGLPIDFDTRLIKPDRMIQIWRAPEGGRLSLWRPYLIRYWRYETVSSAQSLVIGGTGPNELMRRRIVAYFAGETQSDKSDFADDMMKEIVDENFVTDASSPEEGSRDWSNFTVQADLGAGPSLDKAFAWRRVIDILQDLQKASREAGTEVFWDVAVSNVTANSISFEFRTKTGQPGHDLTGLGVFFDQERGNMADPFLEYDYREEVNYVYGLGQGQEDDRYVDEEYEAARYNASQWNRCEAQADARNEETDDGVREAARARLEEGRPRRRFGARAVDTEGTRFDADWRWGDKAIARYRRQDFESIIRAVSIRVDGKGNETVDARLEWES